MPDDLSFEREKWLTDLELRKRELDIKEREQANRDAELRLKEREHQAATWRSPLIVAILAASVAAAGNAVVALVNGSLQNNLERSKAESVRVLEMIRTGDINLAAANLEFLLKAGLIADETFAGKLQHYLNTRPPGTGPALPSLGERVGFARSELLTEPLQNSLDATLSRYFDYLDRIGFPKPSSKVTVAVEVSNPPNAIYFSTDNRIVIDPRLANDPSVALQEYTHHILMAASQDGFGTARAIESGLADYFACSFLKNPKLGETAAKAYDPPRPFIRNLANRKTYDQLPASTHGGGEHEAGEFWGGFFWDLRSSKLGANAADAMLATAWLSFRPVRGDSTVGPAFVAALLAAAKKHGPQAAEVVQSAAAARKIPSPG